MGTMFTFLCDSNSVGIAVADVIGKGIPAALCMSMIKYGMDGLDGSKADPIIVLDVINQNRRKKCYGLNVYFYVLWNL